MARNGSLSPAYPTASRATFLFAMPTALSRDQLAAYQRDGFVSPIASLSIPEAKHFLAEYEQLEASLGGRPKAVELSLTHLSFGWAYDLATHSRVLDAVEGVLGPDILVWATSIFPKQPHDPGYVSFHQDGTYWGLDSTAVVTAWIALTPATIENGCMRMAPETHLDPVHPHRETFAQNNLLTRGQEVEVDIDEAAAVDIVLDVGEMSLHHVNIIHGSNANHSQHKRIGFAVRYMRPAVRNTGDTHPMVLARGSDSGSHHQSMAQRPDYGGFGKSLEAQHQRARRHLAELTADPHRREA